MLTHLTFLLKYKGYLWISVEDCPFQSCDLDVESTWIKGTGSNPLDEKIRKEYIKIVNQDLKGYFHQAVSVSCLVYAGCRGWSAGRACAPFLIHLYSSSAVIKAHIEIIHRWHRPDRECKRFDGNIPFKGTFTLKISTFAADLSVNDP